MELTKQYRSNLWITVIYILMIVGVSMFSGISVAQISGNAASPNGNCNPALSVKANGVTPTISLTLRPKEVRLGAVSVTITETNLTDHILDDSSTYVNGVNNMFAFIVSDEDGKKVARVPPPTLDGYPISSGEFFPSNILAKSSKQFEVPLSWIYKINLPGKYVIQACRYDPEAKDGHGNSLLVFSNSITIYLSE